MTQEAMTTERARHDMYGHEIVPIGNGFGVSVAFAHHLDGDVTPLFSFFHTSDGFRQSLFSVGGCEEKPRKPQVCDVFDDRLREVMAMLQDDGAKT